MITVSKGSVVKREWFRLSRCFNKISKPSTYTLDRWTEDDNWMPNAKIWVAMMKALGGRHGAKSERETSGKLLET